MLSSVPGIISVYSSLVAYCVMGSRARKILNLFAGEPSINRSEKNSAGKFIITSKFALISVA